jgi:hypothetical protein
VDRSKVSEVVARHIDDLKLKLGLGQWDVVVEFDLREPPGGVSGNFITRGRNNWNIDYEKAYIQLDPDSFESEEDVLEALRHELFHLIDAPYTIAWNALKPILEADPVRLEMIDSVWTHATERTVKNIERMYRGLTRKEDPTCPTPSTPSPSSSPAAPV